MSRPKKLFLPHKSACLTGPGRLIWTLGLSGPQTQNPKPLKYCLFEGVRKYSYLFSPFSCLLQILRLIEEKMSNLLGFTHVFDMETSLFLWYLLWIMLCIPNISTPNILSFFSRRHPKGWTNDILFRRQCLYIYNNIYILYIYIIIDIYMWIYIYMYITSNGELSHPDVWIKATSRREWTREPREALSPERLGFESGSRTVKWWYPLVNIEKAMDNHHLQ